MPTASRLAADRRLWLLAGIAVAVVVATVAAALAVTGGSGREPITHGPRDRRWVALTFDADMTPGMLRRLQAGSSRRSFDAEVLRVLRRERAPATVFVTGLWAQQYPTLLRSLARDPLFELENHSMDHSAFQEDCFELPSVDSDDERRSQVSEAASIMLALAGVRTRYFRFPGGCHDDSDLALVESLGHEPVTWDVVSGDSFEIDPQAVAANVLDEVRGGSIVAMHLNGAPTAPATAEGLRIIIPELRRRGYRLVTLRQLLGR